MRKITKIGNNMITLQEAINLAAEAHEGQWRKPEKSIYSPKIQKYENYGNLMSIHKEPSYWRESKPYITHPLAVMEIMSTEEEKIVAVLHDVVEKGSCYLVSNEDMSETFIGGLVNSNYKGKELRLSLVIYEALYLLTHSKGLSYSKYIIELSKNKLATKVKIVDIVHNLSESPSEHAKQKYLKALPILLKGL